MKQNIRTMKAYIHIHNDEYFCHRRVMAEIEIEGVPTVNTCLYMGENVQRQLEAAMSDFYKKFHHEGWVDTYGRPDIDGRYSVEDCIWVWDTCWAMDEDGVYRLHIELNDTWKKKEELI